MSETKEVAEKKTKTKTQTQTQVPTQTQTQAPTQTKVEEEDEEEDEDEDEEVDGEEYTNSEYDNQIPIDLSENEIYKGICTLLEDDQGNNILEYISLLHTELIGVNKSLENLKGIRKEITRIADYAELLVKAPKKSSSEEDKSTKVKKSS
jgi:hypothetical protein